MKRIPLAEAKAGMVLMEKVVTKTGQVIADAQLVLTRQSIAHLEFYGIDTICVEAVDEPAISKAAPQTFTKGNVQNPTYSQKVVKSKEFQAFQLNYTLTIQSIHESFEGFVNRQEPLPTDMLLEKTNELFYSCKTTIELFDMLHNMRSINDSIYAHCLNVALICRMLGKWLKLDNEKRDILTLCGLLHDIGKSKIPENVLNKPGKYTDEEFALVKKHPQFGYDLLKELPLDEHIKLAALMHHERCDGSGYPNHLSSDDIDDCAMIVAIADVYDAMTAARPHRAPLCPFQVISNFEKDGLSQYKPKYILTFLEYIASTYQNNRVLLNNGQSANIVMINKNHLSAPIVQLDDQSCIDLQDHPDLFIKSIL